MTGAAQVAVRAGSVALTRVRPRRLERVARPLLPGLLLAGLVALTAHLAAKLAFPYALAVGFEVPLAMLIGLVLVNIGGAAEGALPGIRFAAKYVLGLGIVLLGLRLNLHSIAVIGSEVFWLLVICMSAACGFAVLLGRRLGVQSRVAVLVGIGSSVCGASAIAAAAPVVKGNDREVSFAVATITIFGTSAVFVLPLVGHAMGLDPLSFGLWAGTVVPDTAQTVASGAAYDTVARDVATVVKLVRTILLAPLLLLIAWGWSRYGDRTAVSAGAARRSARRALPWFVIGFVALAAARTARLVDPDTVADVDVVTRACFIVALAGIGVQTRLGNLRCLGPRPFLLGLGTSSLLAVGSLAFILALGLGPARTNVPGSVDPRPLGAWTPVCDRGEPAFAGAFVRLAAQLPERVGSPVACAQLDEATGDAVQRTSRGVASLRRKTGRVTFSDGRRSWSIGGPGLVEAATERPGARTGAVRLTGRVLARGIPGAGALSPVGTFHPGGPMHDKRAFHETTEPGEILDPTRLLVASTSNFGAPPARADWATGSVLSLATKAARPLDVPSDFAASGRQAHALDGAAQLYTAQSPSFLNRLPNAGADTADMPAVSNPVGISVNNAFGRPWFANAPAPGGSNIGVESVLDPNGRPLSEAPSERAGGVFAGALTNRDRQSEPGGLDAGAIGNALLGGSPDGTGRAVFAVATADGALAQAHVEEGVDGLTPAGTFAPLAGSLRRRGGRPDLPTRIGMVFNWVPERFLYVSDPGNDAILQLHLDDDFRIFRVAATRRLESPELSMPIDLAPAVPEVANPAFSSNTTLAGGADMYVANRGSGTIVRLRQDGQIRAVAQVQLPEGGRVGPGLLNGIAVSPDADRIWLSLSGPSGSALSGSIIEVPAFGAPG
jgi:uncharacterized integral membrane protein (TIGR00698 family)